MNAFATFIHELSCRWRADHVKLAARISEEEFGRGISD